MKSHCGLDLNSLMISDVEHPFVYLLESLTPSLEKNVFAEDLPILKKCISVLFLLSYEFSHILDFNPWFLFQSLLFHPLWKKGPCLSPGVFFRDWNSNFCVSTHMLCKIPQNHFLLDLEHSSICCQIFLPHRLPSAHCWIHSIKPGSPGTLPWLYSFMQEYICAQSPGIAKHCLSEQSIHSWATFTLHWPLIG